MNYILTIIAAAFMLLANTQTISATTQSVELAQLDSAAANKKSAWEDFKVEMADKMRADGGIYIVISVLTIILLGIFGYLIYIDKRLGKIEEELKNKAL